MAGFKSAQSYFLLGNNDVVTTLKFEVKDDLKVKIQHSKLSNYLVGEAEGDNWSAKYNFGTQDFKGELKYEVPAGKLKIHQTVPAGKWQLFPSPHISLTTSLFKDKDNTVVSKDRLKLGYNFQNAVADFEGALWLNDKIKFKAEGNTQAENAGAVVSLNVKPDLPGVHKLGVKYSKAKGTTLASTLKGFDGQVKVKAHAHLQKGLGDAHFKIKHPGWEKSELHLHAEVPFSGRPSLVKVGIHYDM